MSSRMKDLGAARLAYQSIVRWSESVNALSLKAIAGCNLQWSISKAGGPGGQHVNKVNTKACLHYPIGVLPSGMRDHLKRISHQWISGDCIIIKSDEHRSLHLKQEACLGRLAEWLKREAVKAVPRPPGDEQVGRVATL